MYDNLFEEIGRNNRLTNKDIAETANISEKSLFNKLIGKTEFTLKEVVAIKKKHFPECSLDYLFGDGTD